jgi:hypothetical protein
MDDEATLRTQLDKLKQEHVELDNLISKMLSESIVNQIAVQRLKKQKLLLRDKISKISAKLLPDIIA